VFTIKRYWFMYKTAYSTEDTMPPNGEEIYRSLCNKTCDCYVV